MSFVFFVSAFGELVCSFLSVAVKGVSWLWAGFSVVDALGVGYFDSCVALSVVEVDFGVFDFFF